jgi:hypothetical protein
VWLRFHALTHDARFHPDEALFATFARSAALNGDWLLPGALDKPPLSIYLSALAMLPFVDATLTPGLPDLDARLGEFAVRFIHVLASFLLLAVSYALARALYRHRFTALLTLALLACSPYAVSFSATGFTDGFMLLFGVAALWQVAAGSWTWGGICLALALASKQQALLFIPLALIIGWARPDFRTVRVIRLLIPLLIGAALLTLWDAARAQETGFWALGALNNDPWRLLRIDEIVPRLLGWLAYSGLLLGLPWVTFGLLAAGVGAALYRVVRQPRHYASLIDVLLLAYCLGYFALHWLVAFNLYDRYLLPLLIPLALLAARALPASLPPNRPIRLAITGICLALLIPPGYQAAERAYPIGGDRGDHDGIDALAAYLDSRDLGAILYDHWLGWELGYYLGQWTDKRRVYYPTPNELTDGALAQPDPAPRYFIAPHSRPHAPWLAALRAARFVVEPAYESPRFAVYRISISSEIP